MIQWILFDQAGVMTTNVFTNQDKYVLGNKVYTAKQLEKIFYSDTYKQYNLGNVSEYECVHTFLEENNIGATTEEYLALFKSTIRPIPGIKEILESLYKQFKLAALINEGSEWAGYKFRSTEFGDFFLHKIISGDIGLQKPDPEFFKKAIHLIDTKANECIFIDDRKENCEAATTLGIHAIHFENAEQLKKELLKYDIKI